ncbi:argininosuccinate synthase [Aspergillus luchuensis IFO 4308]|nr:argininosuccinate synthase [Aspergillus luchuensis IFO 4308]
MTVQSNGHGGAIDAVAAQAALVRSQQERRPIESFGHLADFDKKDAPVVTMFSGGLDSTYLLLKLQQLGYTNIHAVAVDVGAPVDEAGLTKHAAHFGASFKCLDGRELFVKDGVMPAIRAHASYMRMFPISSSITRPVIARLITDYANSVNAGLLLHTANLSQNSLPRLNNCIRLYGFSGKFGSPYVHSVTSREKKASELSAAGLSIMAERKLSGDENLWCREFEDGPLGDPEGFNIPEEAYEWTRRSGDYAPEKLTLSFENGNLSSINGDELPLIDAIALLNKEVGKFGHGRFVGLEFLSTDDKALEIREAPAAAIIMDALRHLELATLETDTLELKQQLEQKWIREAIAGRWGHRCHTMCEAAIVAALDGVSGSITYDIDHSRFLPCSIVAKNPRIIRRVPSQRLYCTQHRIGRSSPITMSESTKLIYQQDGQLLLHGAKILSIIPVSNLPEADQGLVKDSPEIEHAVVTDSTIFHVQGGGQPSDTGTMTTEVAPKAASIFEVKSVRQPAQGNQILHLGRFVPVGTTQFDSGEEVQQHVDAEKRNLHSRLHTAGHVMSLAIHALCREGVLPPVKESKASHYPGSASVSFEGTLEGKHKELIQAKTDEFVKSASPLGWED